MNIIKKLIFRLVYPHKYSSDAYTRYLQSLGVKIGENTEFFDPPHTRIDENRATYLKIGSGCCIVSGVSIICHDYSWSVLRKSHNEILPDAGKYVVIGDNVFVGWNVTILGNSKIGSNVIIAAGAVVHGDIPDNCVCGGVPARKICSLDEYYERKKSEQLSEAVVRAKHIISIKERKPTIEEMGWFVVLFMDRNEVTKRYLDKLPFKGDSKANVIECFWKMTQLFDSFDEFLTYVDSIV